MALSIHIASMRYPGSDQGRNLIENLDLEVPSGSFVSLLGPSGIGKTTLLRIIAGLERRFQGTILLDGRPVVRPCRDVQVVFQDNRLFPWKTAAENVRFAVPRRTGAPAGSLVSHWLSKVGLNGKAKCWPKTLSGGEEARVALARAFVGGARVLLLDEPFHNVDIRVRYNLHQELQENLRELPRTVILVSHNVEDAVLLSDVIYVASSFPMGALTAFPIPIPKPRQRHDPAVADVTGSIVKHMLDIHMPDECTP